MPKAKATIVADTPEMKRLASNTKIQSNVQYHAEFEANKAKFTSVTDDPESKRLAANSKVQSNISYHGLVEQKEQQEKKRSVIDEGPPSVPNVGEFIHPTHWVKIPTFVKKVDFDEKLVKTTNFCPLHFYDQGFSHLCARGWSNLKLNSLIPVHHSDMFTVFVRPQIEKAVAREAFSPSMGSFYHGFSRTWFDGKLL